MGLVSNKEQNDEAMELALFLYDIYNESESGIKSENGQIDAKDSNDD